MSRADAIVIGAGPAGLIAATYLARFRRSVIVLDGGPSRALWIPESHNTPGFPGGIGGRELVARLRRQAQEFGAQILSARATSLRSDSAGILVCADDEEFTGAVALMATGLVDSKPDIPDIEGAILEGLVRMCPVCDAFEAIGKRIAVLGDGPLGVREARFLRSYSDVVSLLHLGAALDRADVEALSEAGVALRAVNAADICLVDGRIAVMDPEGPQHFDVLYLALGCRVNSGIAIAAGADHDEDLNLRVDEHQRTSTPSLFAAGDVVRGLNQITVAGGEAAVAATAMHNQLRRMR